MKLEIISFLVTLLIAIFLGFPIFIALLFSAVALMLVLGIFDSQTLASHLIDGTNNFALMAIPFFILAGELMNVGGSSKRIIEFVMAMIGHIRGGLGYVAIGSCIIFAGLSGSAVADTAALGAILIPMMVQAGYDRKQSTALIASGGIIAPVIPPSISMIVFGVAAGVSISDLFVAGIVPGLFMGVSIAILWAWMTRKKKIEKSLQPRSSFKEVYKKGKLAIWALFLPVIIIGGIRFGIFTPTESGAVAAFYALFISLVIYRDMKIKDLYGVLIRSAKLSSVVMILIGAAMVPAYLVTVANVPHKIAEILSPLVEQPTLLLLVIAFIVLLMGMVMDATPIILVFAPLLMPSITAAGIDPVVYGLVFILSSSIGLLTPPVGTVLATASSVGRVQIADLSKALIPFLMIYLILLIFLILFPYPITALLNWFN